MRTRDDILSELVELKQNPPQSFSGSMYKTNKKNFKHFFLIFYKNIYKS